MSGRLRFPCAHRRRGVALVGACALLGTCLAISACGGTSDGTVVVRVGDVAITKATVDHWTHVIERKGAFTGFRGEPRGDARHRALALLISSQWLIGEAARQGVALPEDAIEEAIEDHENESPGFRKRLRATGETIADYKLEARAELAGETLRERLAEQASQITRQQAIDYFRANRASFDLPEVRVVDLVENLPSSAAASALVREIGTGRRFAKLAYREHVSRIPSFTQTPEKAAVVNAIFAARPGVASAPMQLNHHWTVFVVRSSLPAQPQSFAAVRGELLMRLNAKRQHELAKRFDREYVARWRAKTVCASGYVGPGCPQDHALLGGYEDPFSLRAHPLLSEGAVNAAPKTPFAK
jgi:PPIC-type PPIASE domain